MDKERIISAISIEFGLSRDQSEKAVESMFYYLLQDLGKNKVLRIRKFGKFKLNPDGNSSGATVKFTPSKKLSSRVNGNFENLKKVKIRSGHLKFEKLITASLEFKDERIVLSETDSGEKIADNEIVVTGVRKKLISDDLIKLHEEITKTKGKDDFDANLWG